MPSMQTQDDDTKSLNSQKKEKRKKFETFPKINVLS